MISKLIDKGVILPCPHAVVLENIDISKISSGCTLYPGTILRGPDTFIGQNAVIGEGGGALIENAQIGHRAHVMQGVYRDCTLLDDVIVRNGAEIREGCLLEEGVELGHTVGLKQTIFLSHVVAGSLINFCDALMAGGTSRKHHSEIGSCMALYNYTPQGDKFASIFGDVEHGIFLNQSPIFIGGQTQIVSPVHIGFGTVIAAGSKLTHSVGESRIVSSSGKAIECAFDPQMLWHPLAKVQTTRFYLQQLELLKTWYETIRIPLYAGSSSELLMQSACQRIKSGIDERRKRLKKYIEKLPVSLELHKKQGNRIEIELHQQSIELVNQPELLQLPDTWNIQ